MYRLAITGGIGSGKTSASEFLCENFKSVYVFNADKELKTHLKNSLSLQHRLINKFGRDITNNNRVNIIKLAEVAFSNKINQKILNGIMWSEAFILINNELEECKKKNVSLFILDAAMIFEAKLEHMFDSTLLVTADKKIRLNRAVKRHNISLEQIKSRMSFQFSETKKKKLADYVINNNSKIDRLQDNLKKFYAELNLP